MQYQNNATKFRREVLIRVAKAMLEDTPPEEIDKIPHRIRPKNEENLRCCIYKDRAVLRLRCVAAMGFSVENEEDDSARLSDYFEKAQERTSPDGPVMTVLDIACKGCVRSRYYVTDACQGCIARPCAVNCPVDAISFRDGRSVINPETCINCGKCKEVCPYHAVTKVPVPCEEACPVDAIYKDRTGHARINFEKCISCGRCMRSCPFGAVMEKSQIVDVLQAIKGKAPVIAMVAPAIAGQFPGDLGQIANGLMKLGFDKVVEVASGADITTKKEAAEFLERMHEGQKMMTTSCCPAYIETVKRHVTELKPFVSDTKTPMHYTAEDVKKRFPGAVTVFVGPCVAKRKEGFDDEFVDYVLTFEEVGSLFVAKDIEVCILESIEPDEIPSAEGRGFPVVGGVAAAVTAVAGPDAGVKPVTINGLSQAAVKKLRSFACGNCPGNLVEVMACEGGCVGGAGVVAATKYSAREVAKVCASSASITSM